MPLIFLEQIDYSKIKGKLNLGLCCINTILRKKDIFCSRTMIRKNFTIEKAKELSKKNVADLIPILEWNVKNNIKCFRISSDMFPHFTDTETEPYDIDFSNKALRKAGKLAEDNEIRLVMHPGQYNQVGAKIEKVLESTIKDLSHHANILDTMGADKNAVIIVHGGGTYGDKSGTINRWVRQFDELPKSVRDRLVIENCEKCYSTLDALEISQRCGIPTVWDNHHYCCYNLLHPKDRVDKLYSLFPSILESWKGKRPLFHISEQREGSKVGAHSDYIESIPDYFFDIVQEYDVSIDLEVEAKMKEQAILRLFKKYPEVF